MRLNRFIAQSGVCSRRSADRYITTGRVAVNDRTVDQPWYQVSAGDRVRVDGKPLGSRKHIYVMFNKPTGVTTTLSDRYADKKVVDYIPAELGRLFPVGRLDKNSRGMLLLTSDGDFCYQMTHPRFEIEKEYRLVLEGRLGPAEKEKARQGIVDNDDLLKVKFLKVLEISGRKTIVKVIISEGKKRHLRRLFKFLGLKVQDLNRVRIGRLSLGSLKEGNWRRLSEKEKNLAQQSDVSLQRRSNEKRNQP